MRRCVPLLLAFVAPSLATASVAAQTPWDTSVADFSRVCVSSLLAPDALAAALKERGMAPMTSPFMPPDWEGALYSATDGERGVTVAHQRYSDLTVSNCITMAPKSASRDELEGLRAALEAQPHVGKLEGRITNTTPTSRIAMFKRPGNAPMVTFNFTSFATGTSLSMTRYDLKSGN